MSTVKSQLDGHLWDHPLLSSLERCPAYTESPVCKNSCQFYLYKTTFKLEHCNWKVVIVFSYVQSNFRSKQTLMASWSKSITVYSLRAKARLQNIIETYCNFLLGGTLGIFEWGCATGILEPLAYSRASSPEFYYRLLD